MSRLALRHTEQPLYRVVRAGWHDPLDASFSRKAPDNRWNTAEFPALYCCCSPIVARAVARDILRIAGVEVSDLQPAWRPRLVELEWTGEVVDVTSAEGIAAAGLPPSYPEGVSKEITRRMAVEWRGEGVEGVASRSASLARLGFTNWTGAYPRWSELAIFVDRCGAAPVQAGVQDDLGWLGAVEETPVPVWTGGLPEPEPPAGPPVPLPA